MQLSDGLYQGLPSFDGAVSRPIIRLVRDNIAFGDIDADGCEEAAVLLVAGSGGSGAYVFLAVVGICRGSAENVATTLIGDRVQVRSLEIVGGRIHARLIEHGPGDPACCPTRESARAWVLQEGSLVAIDGNASHLRR